MFILNVSKKTFCYNRRGNVKVSLRAPQNPMEDPPPSPTGYLEIQCHLWMIWYKQLFLYQYESYIKFLYQCLMPFFTNFRKFPSILALEIKHLNVKQIFWNCWCHLPALPQPTAKSYTKQCAGLHTNGSPHVIALLGCHQLTKWNHLSVSFLFSTSQIESLRFRILSLFLLNRKLSALQYCFICGSSLTLTENTSAISVFIHLAVFQSN